MAQHYVHQTRVGQSLQRFSSQNICSRFQGTFISVRYILLYQMIKILYDVYIFSYQTTLYFTRPGQGQVPLSCVGSLPNMDSAACSSRCSMSVLNTTPSVPRFSSVTSNGSSRPKTIATSSANVSIKLSSPQNLGLLGPICWRGSKSKKDLVEVRFNSYIHSFD